MTKLLHIEKFMPKHLIDKAKQQQRALDSQSIQLSRHIQNHLDGDCYKHSYNKEGLMMVLEWLKDNPQTPFEVEVKEGKVTKYVIRTTYDLDRDISIAIRGNFIVTAWLNYVDDTHKTLDLTKYDSVL